MKNKLGGYLELDLRPEIIDTKKSIYDCWVKDSPFLALDCSRSALREIIRIEGISSIILPYYICNDVKVTLSQLNVNAVYYSIDENFKPKLDSFHELKNFDALIVVSYFGLAIDDKMLQEIKSQNSDLIVIEDKAQSLDESSKVADWAIYSPRKLVGVPDGSIAVAKAPLSQSLLAKYSKKESSLFLENVSPILMRYYDKEMNLCQYDSYLRSESQFDKKIYKISTLSLDLLKIYSYEKISSKRKLNWKYLDNKLSDLAITNFQSEVTPLGYPIKVMDPDSFVKYMAHRGIFCARHWKDIGDYDESFHYEFCLSNSVVTIPCDQRLGYSDLDLIIKNIREYYEKR
ncbi:hypothetical protein [Vibrio chagasii]|uniref:hypothetical protein n=1 Tax=Vibrio chagasii TaxID=170679 RepID=UPI003734E475